MLGRELVTVGFLQGFALCNAGQHVLRLKVAARQEMGIVAGNQRQTVVIS